MIHIKCLALMSLKNNEKKHIFKMASAAFVIKTLTLLAQWTRMASFADPEEMASIEEEKHQGVTI